MVKYNFHRKLRNFSETSPFFFVSGCAKVNGTINIRYMTEHSGSTHLIKSHCQINNFTAIRISDKPNCLEVIAGK